MALSELINKMPLSSSSLKKKLFRESNPLDKRNAPRAVRAFSRSLPFLPMSLSAALVFAKKKKGSNNLLLLNVQLFG